MSKLLIDEWRRRLVDAVIRIELAAQPFCAPRWGARAWASGGYWQLELRAPFGWCEVIIPED